MENAGPNGSGTLLKLGGIIEVFSEAITQERIEVPNSGSVQILTASMAQADSVVAVITSGFSTDPVARWIYPDPAEYFRWFPRFVRAFAGAAIISDSAYYAPEFAGAAMWLPPHAHPDQDALIGIIWDSIPDDMQADVFSLFDQMGSNHPTEPHWYLPMIGVDTYRQGNGIGTALMEHALERCDADGLPAYLESSNPRNISLYRRFGFEAIGEIRAGGSPPDVPMLRSAQR